MTTIRTFALGAAGNWLKDQGGKAVGAVVQAAAATGNFVSKHAATITGVVVSTAVFMGCEGVLTVGSGGGLTIPGAMCVGRQPERPAAWPRLPCMPIRTANSSPWLILVARP